MGMLCLREVRTQSRCRMLTLLVVLPQDLPPAARPPRQGTQRSHWTRLRFGRATALGKGVKTVPGGMALNISPKRL